MKSQPMYLSFNTSWHIKDLKQQYPSMAYPDIPVHCNASHKQQDYLQTYRNDLHQQRIYVRSNFALYHLSMYAIAACEEVVIPGKYAIWAYLRCIEARLLRQYGYIGNAHTHPFQARSKFCPWKLPDFQREWKGLSIDHVQTRDTTSTW